MPTNKECFLNYLKCTPPTINFNSDRKDILNLFNKCVEDESAHLFQQPRKVPKKPTLNTFSDPNSEKENSDPVVTHLRTILKNPTIKLCDIGNQSQLKEISTHDFMEYLIWANELILVNKDNNLGDTTVFITDLGLEKVFYLKAVSFGFSDDFVVTVMCSIGRLYPLLEFLGQSLAVLAHAEGLDLGNPMLAKLTALFPDVSCTIIQMHPRSATYLAELYHVLGSS